MLEVTSLDDKLSVSQEAVFFTDCLCILTVY